MQSRIQFWQVPAATLAALLSLSIAVCVAQAPAATPSAAADSSAAADADAQATAPSSAHSDAIAARYMTPVDTELTSRLDSKNAAVGQEVTARTKQTAKLADGTTLPKGTKLVGHVTQVQAYTKDHAYAALAMSFDRAELKDGQSVALRSVIRTLAPPPAMAAPAADNMMPNEQMGGMNPGSARGGMGLGGGGAVGGTARGVGQTTGNIGQTAGGIGQTAGSTVGDTTRDTRSLPAATVDIPGGAVAQAGETVSTAPRATGLPGVVLATSTTADVSGTLMASGRNISLDTGTQITLGVVTR
jgi:hypothetical protein